MADILSDPLAGLDDVDWAAVDHAYGPAVDVPALLRALAPGGLVEEVVAQTATEYRAYCAVQDGLATAVVGCLADPAVVQTLQDAYADAHAGELARFAAALGLLRLGRATPDQRECVLRTRTDAADLAAYVERTEIDNQTFSFSDSLDSRFLVEFAKNETKGL